MHIPIENIYYLLCYAWNKLEEKERIKVEVDDKMEILDLFAKILINATKILLKRGIDKNYVETTEELAGIKGKIQFSQTIKSNILFKQKTICTFDEFSSNILTNRILLSSIKSLTKTKGLNSDLKKELISLQIMFGGIETIKMSKSIFSQVKLNRNNRFYCFIMNVCQIIYENTLPTEKSGHYKFSDFTRDENKMNQLFEAFIRNFYRLEQTKYNTVKSEIINWKFDYADIDSFQYVPLMKTDITLENSEEKIIIDAKYYRETMSLNFDREKIKSNNLYQLFSYLLNQEDNTEKSNTAKGILLYPTIEKEYDLSYKYREHYIEIKTVNLNANWKDIALRLKSFL
jgi:5-methylcytosine-specific restriction enzyme subunit McrC